MSRRVRSCRRTPGCRRALRRRRRCRRTVRISRRRGRVRGGREDTGELTTDLGAVEAGEFDPADGAEPVQFGEERAQGVAAVDVVGPVGADHDEAAAAQRAEEIGEEVPGGGVGPVQVLQDEDDGPVGGDAFQQPCGELEEAGGSVLVGGVPVGFAEFGEEPRQFALLPGAGCGHFVGQGAAQGAQRRGERGIRQPVGAYLDAAADGDDGLASAGRRQEFLDQPCLADARLATDEQRLRFSARSSRTAGEPGGGAGERIGERGEFTCAADEHGTDGPGLHAAEHRTWVRHGGGGKGIGAHRTLVTRRERTDSGTYSPPLRPPGVRPGARRAGPGGPAGRHAPARPCGGVRLPGSCGARTRTCASPG